MKRIQFISLLGRSPWGGSEELWSRSAQWLLDHSINVTTTVRWWRREQQHQRIEELRHQGAEITYWDGPLERIRFLFTDMVKPLIGRTRLGRRISERSYGVTKADLVVFSSGGNQFPIGPIRRCRNLGVPYVLVIHSVSESSWPRDQSLESMREAYNSSRAVFFVSQANRESTSFQLGMHPSNSQVVVNPFNVPWETPFDWPLAGDCHNWAFVGRLEPGHKGVDLLLRAFGREKWRGRPVHLNFYGTGFSEQSMRRMAEMLGLKESVTFHGQISNIDEVWRSNELLVLPSRHEGLPLVVTEAMLYGRPCLVTDVSGNPELLEEGITGFIAGGPTTNEVDKALERAWGARDELSTMGKNAYESIRRRIPRDPIAVFSKQLLELTADVKGAGEARQVA